MLPKLNRLNLNKDFQWMTTGNKLETKFIKLFIKLGDPSTPFGRSGPRVGIAASGKSFKKATERNRARRLVSAAFELLYARLPKNINILALPKAGVIKVKSQDVLLDLEEKLKYEKIIN